MVVALLNWVKKLKWNSKKFIVFQIVVLQRTRDVRHSRDIRRQISQRMDAWEEGKFTMLVQDTQYTMEANLSFKHEIKSEKQRAKIFHRKKMLWGGIHGAVMYLTEREKGGVLLLGDMDKKSDVEGSKVRESKHHAARTLSTEALQPYPELPECKDLDLTKDSIEKVARRLSSAA
jgi:hypothetical protein